MITDLLFWGLVTLVVGVVVGLLYWLDNRDDDDDN